VKPALSIRAEENDNVAAFIEKYEASLAEAMMAFDKSQILVDYRLLQFWDFLSLRICMNGGLAETFEYVPENYQSDGKTGVPGFLSADGRQYLPAFTLSFRSVDRGCQLHLSSTTNSSFRQLRRISRRLFRSGAELQKIIIVE
jgi:hypothetical protein